MRAKKIVKNSKKMTDYNYSYPQKTKFDFQIENYLKRNLKLIFNEENQDFYINSFYYDDNIKGCIVSVGTIHKDDFRGIGGCTITSKGISNIHGDFIDFCVK